MNTIFSPTISLSSQHQSIINDNDMTKSKQKRCYPVALFQSVSQDVSCTKQQTSGG
jgi:hypothetical protein